MPRGRNGIAKAAEHPEELKRAILDALADEFGNLSRAAKRLGHGYWYTTVLIHELGIEDEVEHIRERCEARLTVLPRPRTGPRHNRAKQMKRRS